MKRRELPPAPPPGALPGEQAPPVPTDGAALEGGAIQGILAEAGAPQAQQAVAG